GEHSRRGRTRHVVSAGRLLLAGTGRETRGAQHRRGAHRARGIGIEVIEATCRGNTLRAKHYSPRMPAKLARTLLLVLPMNASSVAKSGTSAARANSPIKPGAAEWGSNGPGRHRRRICVRS